MLLTGFGWASQLLGKKKGTLSRVPLRFYRGGKLTGIKSIVQNLLKKAGFFVIIGGQINEGIVHRHAGISGMDCLY